MNARDILHYGHLTVLNSLEALPEAAWETDGVCGVWSVKDIVAHLASYEALLIDVLNSFLQSGPLPTLEQLATLGSQRFNDEEVERRKAQTPTETLAEYSASQARTLELIDQIPAATCRQPGTLPWYGAEYALDDFLVYTYYGHKREHCAQIQVFRDRLWASTIIGTENRNKPIQE
jgi:hypothetical protein